MTSTLITNGTLVTLNDQGSIIPGGSVLVRGSTIEAVGQLDGVTADRTIDAGGRIVMPGGAS